MYVAKHWTHTNMSVTGSRFLGIKGLFFSGSPTLHSAGLKSAMSTKSRFFILVHTASGSGNKLLVTLAAAMVTGTVWMGIRLGKEKLALSMSCGVNVAGLAADPRVNAGRPERLAAGGMMPSWFPNKFIR